MYVENAEDSALINKSWGVLKAMCDDMSMLTDSDSQC